LYLSAKEPLAHLDEGLASCVCLCTYSVAVFLLGLILYSMCALLRAHLDEGLVWLSVTITIMITIVVVMIMMISMTMSAHLDEGLERLSVTIIMITTIVAVVMMMMISMIISAWSCPYAFGLQVGGH
jgi:hypothetical protein